MWEEKVDCGEDGHGSGSEGDSGPTGRGGFVWSLAADGLADANCGSSGDGEGHHESEAGAVESYLVTSKGQAAHGADEEGDESEDGNLDEDLTTGGRSEERESTDARGFEVMNHAAEAVAMAALDAPQRDDHEECQVTTRDGGRQAGAGDAERRDVDGAPGVTEDEEPVADYVDEIRCDERDRNRTDVVKGLEVAAEGEVEKECGGAVVERAEEGDRDGENIVVDGEAQHDERSRYDDEDKREREAGCEEKAVEEPTVGFIKATGAVGLCEEGIKTEENTGDTEGYGVVKNLAEGGGRDGESWVGHMSDHDGVDDAHRHPADLGENERKGEREHGPDLVADGHGVRRGVSSGKTKTPVRAGVFCLSHKYN